MSAIVFGSDEAKAVIKANKDVEALELMSEIDWDDVAGGAETEQSGWTATIDFDWMGRSYVGEGDHDYDEEKAIDAAVDDIKEKIKRDILSGKIKRLVKELDNEVFPFGD